MRVFRFGIIGCGLMGREFASAASRWCHLLDMPAKPEIAALCDPNEALFAWYREHHPSIGLFTSDYREVLARTDIDAVYVAVPHLHHEEIYTAAVNAGKHLFGEKPFGIDRAANAAINQAIAQHPECIVRSSSEFPYFPGAQRVVEMVSAGGMGRILEVNAGFLHSSDLNPRKPINWKRMARINGAYGCMGDLGLHVLHVPLRLGWLPSRVYAQLANVVTQRPDGEGDMAPCDTWDNAVIHGDVAYNDYSFPMTCKMHRIAPGETDTWYLEVLGTRGCARFSTKRPRTFEFMVYEPGGPQVWQAEDIGYTPVHPCITGGIFEFGFTDAILQMWAAYVTELAGVEPAFPNASVDEAAQSHAILHAALESQERQAVVHL